MATNAFVGVGTKFKRADDIPPTVYTDIAEVNSIDGPNMSKSQVDVTSLDSTGGYREYIPGFRDGGSLNLAMNFTKATYDLMKTDFESNTGNRSYQIVLPDTGNTTFTFTAFVNELGMAVPIDDKVTANVVMKINGQVVVTP